MFRRVSWKMRAALAAFGLALALALTGCPNVSGTASGGGGAPSPRPVRPEDLPHPIIGTWWSCTARADAIDSGDVPFYPRNTQYPDRPFFNEPSWEYELRRRQARYPDERLIVRPDGTITHEVTRAVTSSLNPLVHAGAYLRPWHTQRVITELTFDVRQGFIVNHTETWYYSDYDNRVRNIIGSDAARNASGSYASYPMQSVRYSESPHPRYRHVPVIPAQRIYLDFSLAPPWTGSLLSGTWHRPRP
jgi:hypothetical protein